MSSNLDNDINFKNMYNYQSKGLITTNDNYNKYIKYIIDELFYYNYSTFFIERKNNNNKFIN